MLTATMNALDELLVAALRFVATDMSGKSTEPDRELRLEVLNAAARQYVKGLEK
jgi:hypothetical protein